MSEIKIKLDEIHPVEILGSNNEKLKIIQEAFPKLQIHARGNELKIQGDTSEIERLDEKLNRMINHVLRHDQLPENRLVEIIKSEQPELKNGSKEDKSDVLVHGNHGLVIRTKTINQQKLYQATQDNDLVFATGPAGTGKTYTSVAIAVRALKNKEVKKIILTRPAVEAGESLGFLPGDISEKVDPYLQPLYDALYDMIPGDKLREYLENKTIEIAPLAFMRGRTLNNAYVILDEAQNATSMQLKMFLTRMGPDAKFMVNGDLTQIDLPMQQTSGLVKAINLLKDIEGVEVVQLDVNDVTRHKLVKDIIGAYEEDAQQSNK